MHEQDDIARFCDFPVDSAQQSAFSAWRAASDHPQELSCGVVVRLDRGFPVVALRDTLLRAAHSSDFAKHRKSFSPRVDFCVPVIGDVVAVRYSADHDKGVIECVLPRRTSFERWRGKKRGTHQVLAANIDTVLVAQALGSGRDLHIMLDHIARSLVLALDCGTRAVIVLTKADRLSFPEKQYVAMRVEELAGTDIPVVLTSAYDGQGLDALKTYVPHGSVAMIVGESGAGKSSLLNALVGYEVLATGEVRRRDDVGRHTTVARVMIKLPTPFGVVTDAPGLRSLPLVGHECGLAQLFSDIVERAHRCRFRDCTHTHEPGCALREALSAQELSPIRLDMFLALAAEMRVSAQSLDPDVHV